eukprot:11161466-Alexandrium_andersonii.AAC.1
MPVKTVLQAGRTHMCLLIRSSTACLGPKGRRRGGERRDAGRAQKWRLKAGWCRLAPETPPNHRTALAPSRLWAPLQTIGYMLSL